MSVFKNTKLTERLNLQFQAIAYNLLNQRLVTGVPMTKVLDQLAPSSPESGAAGLSLARVCHSKI
jgi:hypothetical protein